MSPLSPLTVYTAWYTQRHLPASIQRQQRVRHFPPDFHLTMSEPGSGDWHMVLGAKVQWPADMPDNMLEFVIESAKATIGAVDNWHEGTDADDAVAALR